MELIKNLRYMCRICAVNIKKRRSSSSAVSILETTQLTEKLKKYLNIDINSNDVLPKSICSVCYKKVEAIHALAALAKKTENFLTDFIKIAQNNLKQQVQHDNFQTNYNDEFNQFSLLDNNDCINDNDIICCEDDQRSSEPEEVVLNFTLNDPLTKNIQKKIVVAKQKKQQQNLLNQRQQEQQREHKKFEHDLSQYSTSITPTMSTTQPQQYKNNSDHTTDLIKQFQAFSNNNNKRNELNNTSLEQKRQNLKMILNNNTTNNSTVQQQNFQQPQQKNISPETSTNSYKLIIPNSGGGCGNSTSNVNQTGGHSINVAVQIQQQSPTIYSPNQQQQSELLQQSQNIFMNNNRTAQMMNDCLNLGSVIKDMDLLKLILKALKWPFNQETLNTQIQRLKSTRFRDVMIDPNLLQDTDLMQILSSYLSPILLQTSPSQTSNLPSSLLTASNILPPSVSYKIPAETSVRLVCVPREEQQQNEQQQKHKEQENYQQQSSQTTISSSHSTKKHHHHHSYNFDSKSHEYQKSKKKHYKVSENYRRSQQQHYEPIIILSDDDDISHDDSSDNIQKFEVNVDPMLYFNGADSSYENSNESTMITMGYFKQHQQQQNQQCATALNAEVTLQKRKKQKRKQTLIQNPINKNILDQEILIVDENGEKPIHLNNELLCIPSKKKFNDNNIPTTSKNYSNNNDYLNIPSTSNMDKLNAVGAVPNFEFTTPKKKRKLNTLKSSKSSGLFTLPKSSKNKVPLSDSMVIIHKTDLSKNDNKFPLQNEIKLEKNLNDVSIIAVNKNYESTKKIETASKPELMPKKPINDRSLKTIDNVVETLEKNIIKEPKVSQKSKSIEQNEKESLHTDKIDKCDEKTIHANQQEISKEIPENINEDNLKVGSCSGGGDDDADSVDTNGELVIDEGYDEEKLKDDENNKSDNNCEKESELKSIPDSEEIESKLINLQTTEEIIVKNADETSSKAKENNDSLENNTLRRSRRQTKFKTPIMKSVRKNTNTIKKNLVTAGATVVTNVKKTVVSTRGKTRQQEQKTQKTKMQTRNSNISQRGREQKPFTKYSKKKS